jgi:uncharacterized protein involved in response to NO
MATPLYAESGLIAADGPRAVAAGAHARMLAVYVGTALLFMLLPGTFLGVWNLIETSTRQNAMLVSPAWMQAHGHAQVFGWVATFILGIGLYSVPVVRPGAARSLGAAWVCWALWTTGVALRWYANVSGTEWRVLLPLSATLELVAFLIFFTAMSAHRSAPSVPGGAGLWVKIVVTASVGFGLTLVMNLALAVYLSWHGDSPAIPHALNQRFLTLMTWGFLAPFVWAFSTKWLPVLLGLQPLRTRLLAAAVIVNTAGVVLTLAGWGGRTTVLFVVATVAAVAGLRLFEPAERPAKTFGVHWTFPLFVRLAYGWLLVAATLGVAAAAWDVSGGIWGASRHAFTVGFISMMVFSIGQRVLPAFAAAAPLWSPRLMFVSVLLLAVGCALRVTTEIIAYQHDVSWAWSALPVSAIVEMAAITAFAINLGMTFLSRGVRITSPPVRS